MPTDCHSGRQEAARHCGVRWSGLGPEPAIRLDARWRAVEAAAATARAAQWAASPQKAYLDAVRSLRELGWAEAAQTACAALERGFARPGRPANPREIGAALKVLNTVGHSDARTAIGALADLLLA